MKIMRKWEEENGKREGTCCWQGVVLGGEKYEEEWGRRKEKK